MTPPLLPTPIAAAHLSILNHGPENYPEPRTWNKVPDDKWGDISLNGNGNPIPTEPMYTFGIDHPETRDAKYPGTIAARINWVVSTARRKHPGIKIFAMQYYGTTALFNLVDGNAKEQARRVGIYAKFVAGVLKQYDLDGFDIDYEWNSGEHDTQLQSFGNLWEFVPDLLAQVRAELDELTKSDTNNPKRQYYVSLTPASPANLDKRILDCVSHVSVQTYDGGWAAARANGTTMSPDTPTTIDRAFKDYLDMGFTNDRLLFGIMPEITYATYEGSTPQATLVACSGSNTAPKFSPSLELALTTYSSYKGAKLAGIHSWQINSEAQLKFENRVQVVVYNELHNPTTPLVNDPATCNRSTLATDWKKLVKDGGGGAEGWALPKRG